MGRESGWHQVAQLDVAAASGIVRRADALYVIADDSLDLAVYDLRGQRVRTIGLVPGVLPEDHAARKAQKPDFEALVALPDGSLLALGSGSTAQRTRGVCVPLGAADETPFEVDLSELYSALERELPELNIEGGVVSGSHLYLASRGNGARRDNVLVDLELARVLEALRGDRRLGASCLRGLERVTLGELAGVPLSLTDLTADDAGLIFSAAAEDTANTYDDGATAGSVLGRLSAGGVVSRVVSLGPQLKIEGICSAGPHELYAVADADDPHARAPLLRVPVP